MGFKQKKLFIHNQAFFSTQSVFRSPHSQNIMVM